jgi:L,D-transpeptidase ErfK/SrfK
MMLTRRGVLASGIAASALVGARARADLPAAERRTGDRIGELTYVVTREETILLEVAQRYDVGILEVSAVNPGVDPWVPGADRLITLPTAHLLPDAPRKGIVINKAELRLYYFDGGGGIETHAIGIGREGHDTPTGHTTIVRKQKNPSWYPTAGTRADRPELPATVPPGPDNPLGDRAMYLGWPTYVIHGTNKPFGVGRLVSRGCIRMYPEASHALFDEAKVGTGVTVIEQPIKVGWDEGELWIEVHPAIPQLVELEESYSFTPGTHPASAELARERIMAHAGPAIDQVRWNVVEAELIARRGIPVQITGVPQRRPVRAPVEAPAAMAVAPEPPPASAPEPPPPTPQGPTRFDLY